MNNIKPTLPADKLLEHLLNTTRCNTCGKDYSIKFPECPICEHIYAEDLDERIADSMEEYA